ncbi:cupin domain-containing protein [Pseudarthrobacter sp. GA104]|uniref:cupin domain-containing protein n=1 Tax=Pseudarthrobacter sp. GA104 TaxID=2676311 RepID=UPI0012FCEEBA|nr:cupin domain-containing protein [Pseudarthrobacter sp. GA104]MUU69699.1 cupin domain-containing protein [Pseudarthrobacter sp. GA104]
MHTPTEFFTGNGFSRLTGRLAEATKQFNKTLDQAREDAGFLPKGNLREPVLTAEFPGCPTDIPINFLAHPGRLMDYCLIRVQPGRGFPEHVHGYGDEIYLIISGHGKVRVDGVLYDAGPEDVFHHRAGVAHELFNPSTNTEVLEVFAVNVPGVHEDLRSEYWGIPVDKRSAES